MTEGEAFLTQAKSDLRIFDVLLQQDVESCHALHYLQMATEKLAKAIIHAQQGTAPTSHVAVSKIIRMISRGAYADKLGFKTRHDAYDLFLDDAGVIFDAIERLCLAVAESQKHSRDMPNVEYPWILPNGQWQAPCELKFQLGNDIHYNATVKQTLKFLKMLAEGFDEIF